MLRKNSYLGAKKVAMLIGKKNLQDQRQSKNLKPLPKCLCNLTQKTQTHTDQCHTNLW